MKKTAKILALLIMGACSNQGQESSNELETNNHDHSTEAASAPKSKSPKQMAMSNVGDNHVHIEYHSPSKRGRQIFGGLVAYNEIWVTGAHSATSINFSKDVVIGGTEIPSGKYALFTIPGQNEWTVVINKNWEQHLADEYDEAEDVVRLTVTPEALSEIQESLMYQVTELNESVGTISISWDNLLVSFEVKNKN